MCELEEVLNLSELWFPHLVDMRVVRVVVVRLKCGHLYKVLSIVRSTLLNVQQIETISTVMMVTMVKVIMMGVVVMMVVMVMMGEGDDGDGVVGDDNKNYGSDGDHENNMNGGK